MRPQGKQRAKVVCCCLTNNQCFIRLEYSGKHWQNSCGENVMTEPKATSKL